MNEQLRLNEERLCALLIHIFIPASQSLNYCNESSEQISTCSRRTEEEKGIKFFQADCF